MKKWPTEFPENYPDKDLYENDFPSFNRKYNIHLSKPEHTIHSPMRIFEVTHAERFSKYWWKDVFTYPFSKRGLFFDLYTFYHRGRYGWAPMDVWSFDSYLERVIGAGLNHLAENSHGAPSGFPNPDPNTNTDFDLWSVTLKQWSKSFADSYYYTMNSGELATYESKYPVIDPVNDPHNFNLSTVKEQKLSANISNSLVEMSKWFRNLWD